MFRREWRQQALVLGLLAVAVAAATGFATAAYNVAPMPANAEFGTANHLFHFDDPEPRMLRSTLTAAEEFFGTIDVIGHRDVAVPGAAEPVDYRAQDPDGAYGAPLLELRDGRYPTSDNEIAVTDGLVDSLELAVGTSLDLDGVARTVVGLVENPSNLDDEFALVSPLSGSSASSGSVTILVDATQDAVRSFRPPEIASVAISSRAGQSDDVLAAASVLVVATVALVLVGLVATASFVVVAQRRRRQLGMLGAIGATERQLRLVMVANGAVTGALAAVVGVAVGVGAWILLVPRVETAAGHRLDAFNVPWWIILTGMLLAVGAAIGASWWPARTMSRVPSIVALSGRPSRPAPVHRSAGLAGLLIGGGIGCLTLAGDVTDDGAIRWDNLLLVGAGTVATILGVLLVSPLAIRMLVLVASRTPVAVRVALRDLGRYQARSSAALAAISLALGLAVAIVVTAAAAQHTASAGNLAARQLLVRAEEIDGPFVPMTTDVDDLQRGVDQLAAALDDPEVISLNVAIDPAAEPISGIDGREAISLGEPIEEGWRDVSLLYVATPQLLDDYGVDVDAIEAPILTVETGQLHVLGAKLPPGADRSQPEVVSHRSGLTPTYSSLPGTFITTDELRRRGWESAPSGQWLIEAGEPLTGEQRQAARDAAVAAGLTVEWREGQGGLANLRTIATIVGMVLALGILAMTVGLIRGEAAGDVRTLTATGATSLTRRTLTSATAAGLAVLGVALGTIGAYLTLVASHVGGVGDLSRIPAMHLGAILVGTPIAAACAGWLLAGREPAALARNPIE